MGEQMHPTLFKPCPYGNHATLRGASWLYYNGSFPTFVIEFCMKSVLFAFAIRLIHRQNGDHDSDSRRDAPACRGARRRY